MKEHVRVSKRVNSRTWQAVQEAKIITPDVPEVAPLDRESSVGSR
jgi:hypothetical protein